MIKKDYYSKLLTSFSDPTMVASAFESYFRRVYERTIDKVGVIISKDELSSTEYNDTDLVALTINEQNYIFKIAEVKDALSILSSDNTEVDILDTVTLLDRNTNREVSLLISDVSRSMGECIDNAYVTWQGFRSLIDNTAESANNFLTNVSIKMSNTYGGLKDSVLTIFNTLHNSDMSIMDKLNYLCQFSGLKQATENPDNIENAQIELAKYTGINPVIGWISGVNWSNAALNALTIPILVRKFVAKCMVTVMKGVVGVLSKAFSWIGNWFKKTFIDPVDYKCDDPTLEYFKIPAKFCYALNLEADGSLAYDKQIFQWFLDYGIDSELWLNDARIYRKLTIDVTAGKPYVIEERYISPISPEKLFGVLGQYISKDDWVTVTSSGGVSNKRFNGLRTPDDMLNLFSSLNGADLSINSKSPEKDVYAGLFLSLYLNEQINKERGKLYTAYKSNVSSLLQEMPNTFNNYYNERYGDLYAVLYEYVNGQSFDEFERSLTLGNRTYTVTDIAPSAITNANFIQRLTHSSGVYFVNGQRQYDINQLSSYAKFTGSYLNVWDPDLITGTNSGMSMNINGSWHGVSPDWMYSVLVLLQSRVIHKGDEYDGAFVPYLDHTPVFKKNIDVVTDQEHQEAITNFVKGAAIAAAIVTATVVGGIVIAKTLKRFKQLALSAGTLGFNYGQAVQNGDIENANILYKQYKSKAFKANLLGFCLGKSSDLAGTAIDGLNIALNGENSNSQILDVILPKKIHSL